MKISLYLENIALNKSIFKECWMYRKKLKVQLCNKHLIAEKLNKGSQKKKYLSPLSQNFLQICNCFFFFFVFDGDDD